MTRRELVKDLSTLGLTRHQASKVVDSFFERILSALKEGRKVSLVGFGTWEWRDRVPRNARNPKTGKVLSLGPRKIVFFKPSRLLKEKLNQKK